MKVRILYPENRSVDIQTVIGWAQDIWEDQQPKDGPKPVTLEESKNLLEDQGLVTFAKES